MDFKNKRIFFDGAMGTMLQKYNVDPLSMKDFDIVGKIHEEYLCAGSNILTANTFSASTLNKEDAIFILKNGLKTARKVAKDKAMVALDVGASGKLLEPLGSVSFEDAFNVYKNIFSHTEGADIILIETMSDIYEAKAAILAAKECTSLPIFCTMSFVNDRTISGTDVLTMVTVLEALGVDVLGLNCSFTPKDMMPLVKEVLKYSTLPVMVQPNAGQPKIRDGKIIYENKIEEFLIYTKEMADMGVNILGGCCGTTPEYISALVRELGNIPYNSPPKQSNPQVKATSASKTVVFEDELIIIGQNINPCGKLKDDIKDKDTSSIIEEAFEQKDSDAHILDINLGEDKEFFVDTIKEIQAVVNLPLQIDTMDTEILEECLKIYNGKPIINSVNLKTADKILPLAKKYGALVVFLTVDENGVPEKAKERVLIAEKLVKKALEYGIKKHDIIIDTITLTAGNENVHETVEALKTVKKDMGLKTMLGISNISHGTDRRDIFEGVFLGIVSQAGVDAVIMNPSSEALRALSLL